jgi:hypothetical protein
MQSAQTTQGLTWVDQMRHEVRQEGAETAIWLATREFDPAVDKTGLLWEDRQIVEW